MEDMDCRDVVELITEYLEGTLSADVRESLEQHFLECDGCDRYLAQINHVRLNLGKVDFKELSPEERIQFLTTFQTWKDSKAS